MSKKGFWWRALAMLVLVGLVVAGGFAVHYLAWSRGYAAGQVAEWGEEVVTSSYLPHGFGHYGRPVSFLFGAGTLFKCLLGLIFFAVACKLIRFIVWGAAFGPMMCGPWPKHFHRGHWRRAARRHWMHGPPMPPWFCDWDEADEEDADEDTDKAEA
jgi:hypothetical protein